MNFYRAHALRERSGQSPRKHNSVTTSAFGCVLAALAFGASIDTAHANPSTPATKCAIETIVAVANCPAPRKFEALFDYHSDSPILNLRAGALSLNDITGSIPDLHFDLSPPKLVTSASLTPPETEDATDDQGDAMAPAMIVGIASMYNPYNPNDKYAGGPQTASGELYDAGGWTAAIRLDLRDRFGGVRYGRNYRPTYAMVEAGAKRVIVKINDVGPLRPGRIIDFNERTMRFFDPSLELGLINGIRVTPLAGTDWVAGPVGGDEGAIKIAGNYGP
ncbi:MAG: RlpA-like double-psi beta-barrel domain-containing protein [Pseudolabrys sp.]